ncbi:MAG: hypothetical protein ACTSRP_22275 [Candidatus Helarchaeota archaeon]
MASGSNLLFPFLVEDLEYDSIGIESTVSLLKYKAPVDQNLFINCKFIWYKILRLSS